MITRPQTKILKDTTSIIQPVTEPVSSFRETFAAEQSSLNNIKNMLQAVQLSNQKLEASENQNLKLPYHRVRSAVVLPQTEMLRPDRQFF